MRRLFALTAALGFACSPGSEASFIAGLDVERCDSTVPSACSIGAAGCVLTTTQYLEGSFPGLRQFIVQAPEGSVIRARIFLREMRAAGIDTEIVWHEPGCSQSYIWSSEGRDLFFLAGNDRVFEESRQVFFDGDHLIEVFSDAVAEYFLALEVEAPAQ